MEETGLVLRPFIGALPLGLLAAALIALSVLAYARTTRALSVWFRSLLVGLRLIAVALLLVCLLRPTLQTTHYETVKRPLVMLIDKSRSMTAIDDTPTKVSRLQAVEQVLADNKERLNRLGESYEVVTLAFARGILDRQSEQSEAAVGQSAYGLALERAFAEAASGQCDAMVVFGDGSHNAGGPDPVDVAAGLGEQGIPVYTVGVGQDEATSELRDARVLDVLAPRNAFLFSSATVRADVVFRGCLGMQVKVRLDMQEHRPVENVVSVGHAEETVPVEFQVVPEKLGEYKLTVTVEPVPNEVLSTNNSASTFIKVISSGSRVALFDVPRPEATFIARALQGAERLMLRRVSVLSGQALPGPQTETERYDVVVLGDLPHLAMLPSRMLELRQAVQEQGKGLVVLLTQTSGGPAGWQGTPIEELLPVRIGAAATAQGERRFVVAPEYADHPIVALGATVDATSSAWAEMPPLAGAMVGFEPKRGATVLARDQEGNPLLVVHRAGRGRVACLMADTTFRWFFTEQGTQDYHRRFWRQLVAWAAGSDEPPSSQLRVELSRQQVPLNEDVRIAVRLTDGQGQPIRDAQLALRLTDPRGGTHPLSYSFSRQDAAYVAEYAPAEPGDYRVAAEAEREGTSLGEDTSYFHASQADLELETPVADLKLLRRMSAVTEAAGGQYCNLMQADELFERLKARANPLKLTTRSRTDMWDRWLLFAAFAACMGLQWGLRKWRGLV